MRHTVLMRFLSDRPFQPFRLVLTDGKLYDIRHPDQARANQSDVEVMVNDSQAQMLQGDFIVSVSYLHIVRIEPLLNPFPIPPINGSA